MTINNPYNQQQIPPQMGQGMMPPPPPRHRMPMPRPMLGQRKLFPDWLTRNAIIVYVLALAVVTLMYNTYALPWYYMLSGVMSIVIFFFYGSHLAVRLSPLRMHRERVFEQRIFLIAFIPRVLWMFLIYYLFMQNYGDAFGFENGDATYYDEMGTFVSDMISKGQFNFVSEIAHWNGGRDDISDMGYGIYVGLVYYLTDNSIITVRLLKCIWSSLTVLLIYRLAKRNFSPQTARIAAIFCALWPNFWYYCGVHLKETEMVFLCVLFVEQTEQMLRSRQFTVWKVIPILIIAAIIFTFRTVLAIVLILALLFTIIMSSSRVVRWGKRIIVGLLAVALVGVIAGDTISEQTSELIEEVRSDKQVKNMEWRANRENGNAFAKYASTAVFAPLIFTIPFPTMVEPFKGQEVHELLNGGNFVKNILSYFTIFAMVILLLTGRWREHLLSLSFLLGYLLVLTMSTFAQSERFHQPVMPFEFMFAAYGLSIAVTKSKYKRWFTYWCGLMFIAAIAWNWFKLAGRGLV